MIIRRAEERGHADHGWLRSYHSFSFADYHDPAHVHFRALRVINDDYVQPGHGFGTHPHADMEIVTYVLDGELQHKDSMGNGSVIRPGEVQRMTAGTGVTHSELNSSPTDVLHLLQIWIFPERKGLAPGYEQKSFSLGERRGRLCLVASRDGRDGSVTIHQDAAIHAGVLGADEGARFDVAPGRHAYLHVARGAVTVNGAALHAGDGAAVSEPGPLVIAGGHGADGQDGEILLFDLA